MGRKKGKEKLFQWYKSFRLCGYSTIPAEHLPVELEVEGMLGLTSYIAQHSSATPSMCQARTQTAH